MKYRFTVDEIDLETCHGQILSQIRPGSCVLECGCSTGYITKFMKEQLGCKVYIVEYEQEAFDIARQYAEGGICADLTMNSWCAAFEGMQFDYILFMDVLEHLTKPEETLRQATALLKHDGTVLISLPNIAHNDILINLHLDTFNYTDLGLLDNTHVHFFGKNNLDAFVGSAGLRMVRLGKTIIQTGTSEQFWEVECRVSEKLLPILKDRDCGEVYQFIIAAQKESYCMENGVELVDDIGHAGCGDQTVGILDVYRRYTQTLEQLNTRTTELLQAEQCHAAEKKDLEQSVERWDARYHDLQKQYDALNKRLEGYQNDIRSLELLNRNLSNRYSRLELTYDQIITSRGWRMLSKYYAIRDAIFPKNSAIREFVKKIAQLLLGKKERPAWDRPNSSIQSGVANESVARTVDGFELISKCKRIDILSVPHTAYIAKMLQNILIEAGLECETHLSEPEVYEDIPYIMICPQNFKRFPDVYIAFQMEQTINPRWLTDEYMNILQNAYAIFDYSLENISFFSKDPALASKLYYLPVDVCQSMMQEDHHVEKKEYDVLFYGAPFVENRQRYLRPIGEKYKLRIVSSQFGPELYREMNKAKLLINIHYYENALLETTRIYESLSVSDCLILSERSGDPREEAALEGIVDFVEAGNVEAMMERIEYWLSHEEERRAAVERNRTVLRTRSNAAKFYLNRFLLANDRVKFDDFYDAVGDHIRFNTERICLSLPESTERRAAFDADNMYGFEVFPGLKHRMGWIGCGMSYKFMLRKAMEQKMKKILICEDDVYFPPDFQERFDHILEYVDKNNDWNAFSGIMADIGRVKPLKYVKDGEEEFIYLDKMISMVFNLYNESIFETISSWDNMDRDVKKNTIDRYLEDKNLRVLTTCPFLVGHKEELRSTIWGQQNTIYTELISSSSIKLQKLVDDFKKQRDIED